MMEEEIRQDAKILIYQIERTFGKSDHTIDVDNLSIPELILEIHKMILNSSCGPCISEGTKNEIQTKNNR